MLQKRELPISRDGHIVPNNMARHDFFGSFCVKSEGLILCRHELGVTSNTCANTSSWDRLQGIMLAETIITLPLFC
ncbi:hypothetical protein CEXT_361 [Caerostris extrusa]|uniref:Uncharacterized protein n=1 Tax=Caerostris extrusa TaxID=172846 RepID=A0AAV4SG34_CAEEX|nr:hypothetical protein CEXT_361 [Caerostris extrusa]